MTTFLGERLDFPLLTIVFLFGVGVGAMLTSYLARRRAPKPWSDEVWQAILDDSKAGF